MDGEAWQATVHGVAQSRTRLKRLSSSSSLHLRQEVGGHKADEKATGVSQLQAPTGYGKWKVHAGVQVATENDQTKASLEEI